MNNENDTTCVRDDRKPEAIIFYGTTIECIEFMMEEYPESSPDFEHIWID